MTNEPTTLSRSGEPVSALEISGLRFSYAHKRTILEDINLTVRAGERVGLIGPNGAGKTTLFLLACGVLEAESGQIELFGRELATGRFHPEIGMVFQNAADQLFSPTVWDDVAFGPQNLGLSNEEVARRVEAALKTTGVADLADRAPHHLSGGEKRMVSIAGVLAMQPRMIIYDEPSASLDMRARRRLIEFLRGSTETLLISSHDLEFVLEVCDRVILLDEGRVIADGCPGDVMSDIELMEAHGLEKPHSLTFHVQPHHHPC